MSNNGRPRKKGPKYSKPGKKPKPAKIVDGAGIIDVSDGFEIDVFPDTIRCGPGGTVTFMVANHMDANTCVVSIDEDKIEIGGKHSGRHKNPLAGSGKQKVGPNRAEPMILTVKANADFDVYSYTIEAFDVKGSKKNELDPDLDVIDPGARPNG